MFLNNPEITKKSVIEKSIQYWNPSKTTEWQKRGIDLIVGKREGYYFWDMDGNKFLNIHINGGTYNLGHRNPELVETLKGALDELDVGNHHFPGITKALLAERLSQLSPGGLNYTVYSAGGGEAVDVAIKSARYATKRKKVISIAGCYHGHTGLSVSAGDPVFKDPFLCQGESGEFVQVPLNDIDAMEAELKKEDTACVLMETILATYGFPLPNPGYIKAVKALCEKYGTLYVADEVQTGLMRTGKFWGFEHEDIEPDMIITAKGFGGGIYPIAATILNEKAAAWLFDIGRLHGSTCGGSELGCAVSLKMLEITTRAETVANIHKNSGLLEKGVADLKQKYNDFFIGSTQRGVIMGLEFDCKDASYSVCKPLYDNGVWAHNSRLHPNIVQLKLGLLCDDLFMEELFDKMDKGIHAAREACLSRQEESMQWFPNITDSQWSTILHTLYSLEGNLSVHLLMMSENATFCVTNECGEKRVLRVHRPQYNSPQEIESELIWMSEIKNSNLVAVPRTFVGKNGQVLQQFELDGVKYHCSMISFMKGFTLSHLSHEETVSYMKVIGETTAKLHQQAKKRDSNRPLTRKQWTFENMFGKNSIWGDWKEYFPLTPEDVSLFSNVLTILEGKLEQFSQLPNTFGIIHADMHPKNIIVDEDCFQIIDFDDCGYGFYLYDLGCTLVSYSDFLPIYIQSWVEGYQKVCTLSETEKEMLLPFVILRRILRFAWLASHSESDTAHTMNHENYLQITRQLVQAYLK